MAFDELETASFDDAINKTDANYRHLISFCKRAQTLKEKRLTLIVICIANKNLSGLQFYHCYQYSRVIFTKP
ncbi:hypothetical protein T4D_5770 [Trichinella pseudospiralis]|uniref:Uncharacterized protein n=1 Tax=Trichinella pseudospiralis TaxID=6337 RepID=A0A0V1F645_TRIPS|nr:hypothetical protein T4D_5770 [Trichinella pseudospiralis]